MTSKKILKFVEVNFPSYLNATILKENDNEAIVLLDYGKYESKLRVKLKKCIEEGNLLKLEETQFIN